MKSAKFLKCTALALLSSLALFGCGEPNSSSEHEQEQQEQEENTPIPRVGQTYENDSDAKLCIVEKGDYDSLTADTVALDETSEMEMVVGLFLLSYGGRGEILEQSCSVELDGETLTVESRIAFGPSTPSSGDSVVNDERFMVCDLPALSPGEYEVHHGESTYTLTIPSDSNLDCGDSLFNTFWLPQE